MSGADWACHRRGHGEAAAGASLAAEAAGGAEAASATLSAVELVGLDDVGVADALEDELRTAVTRLHLRRGALALEPERDAAAEAAAAAG